MTTFLAALRLKDYIIAALAALCLALTANTYLTLKLGPVQWEGWKPKAERLRNDLNAILEAQHTAANAQRAVNEAAAKRYRDLAKESEDEKRQADVAVRDATERYIRANRVRQEAACGASSGADTAAESGGAGVGEGMSSPPLVVISEPDVRACSEWTTRGVMQRELLLRLAEPAD